jgi:hypothetical protein
MTARLFNVRVSLAMHLAIGAVCPGGWEKLWQIDFLVGSLP